MTAHTQELIETIESLQNHLVSVATGGDGEDEEYRQLRQTLMELPRVRSLLPQFVRTCRDNFQFWQFIKYQYGTYQERRDFIWDSFRPLLEEVESQHIVPSDEGIAVELKKFDETHVHQVWQKALDRRTSDPEGAITIARTLLETVCKHILDDLSVSHPKDADLPKLYHMTAEALNLAPSQHSEKTFKSILGACQTVVNNLGTLRNRIGDAHGQGRKPIKPKARHAELAVNLSGAMVTFLVSTWREKTGRSQK